MTPAQFRATVRTQFPVFLGKVFAELHPGQALDLSWLHQAMAFALEQCRTGDVGRLIIAMPPRSLKSITVSVAWSAWLLGQDPTTRIMCVSYSDELARLLATLTRQIMQSAWYLASFPGTVLVKSTETELTTTKGGFRRATSIGGSVTGFGGDWIIIDDPQKAEEALSKAARDKVNNYFSRTMYSRLDDHGSGRIVLVQQRLHEDDLAGFLLEKGKWPLLKVPAIAPEDVDIPIGARLTHRRLEGDILRGTRASLDVIRSFLGTAAFQAQYQQEPSSEQGIIIHADWLCEYVTPPDHSQGRLFLSLDTAQKTEPSNDYSVVTVWLWVGDKHYLLAVLRERRDYPALRTHVMQTWDQYRPERLLIEDAGSGTSLIQELKGHRSDIRVVPIKVKLPKDVRVGAASAMFENRQVYLPNEAPWLAECLHELLGFPGTKHDDIVDSVAQYLNWVRSQEGVDAFVYDFFLDAEAPQAENAYWRPEHIPLTFGF